MITRGELQSINFNENTCTVRVPLFETAGTKDPIILPALFAIQPGACNGYLVGDKVWVAFEGGESLSHVVVIGKMYIDIGTEKEIAGGGITCADLTVKNSAVIPVNTKISFDSENPIKNAAVSLTSYNSLNNIIKSVSDNCAHINALEDSINSGYLVSANSTGEIVGPLNTININGKTYSISGGSGGITETTGTGQIRSTTYTSQIFGDVTWSLIGKQLVLYFSNVLTGPSPYYTLPIEITELPNITFAAHNFWTYSDPSTIGTWNKLIFTKSTATNNAAIAFAVVTFDNTRSLEGLNNRTLTILTD